MKLYSWCIFLFYFNLISFLLHCVGPYSSPSQKPVIPRLCYSSVKKDFQGNFYNGKFHYSHYHKINTHTYICSYHTASLFWFRNTSLKLATHTNMTEPKRWKGWKKNGCGLFECKLTSVGRDWEKPWKTLGQQISRLRQIQKLSNMKNLCQPTQRRRTYSENHHIKFPGPYSDDSL